LKEAHITHEDGSKALGEGTRSVSWIWHTSLSTLDPSNELDEGLHGSVVFLRFTLHSLYKALRIEWAWSLAQKERWEEEINHLQEEMRRFIASASHELYKWLTAWPSRSDSSPELHDGLRSGYACCSLVAKTRQFALLDPC
jgi:hypothetical protein